MFHGSPHKLTHLRAGSWVTPHQEDAAVFGVPWSSHELKSTHQKDGRPPKTLRFKEEAPEDHPVYVYRVAKGDIRPAATNTGANYDWNHQVHGKTKVELVNTIPSWKEQLMPFKSEAQRRKFYALKAEGKMSQKTIDEWQAETPKKLPDRLKKHAYVSGQRAALEKLGFDAESFEEFAQEDDTADALPNVNKLDAPNGTETKQDKLINPASPWTGSTPFVENKVVDI